MSNPRIEVDVVANVAGVASGVAAATSQLNNLGNAAQATAPKVDGLTKATSRYNTIGIDFARVIQDAPFGIIGVGNNITQLAQSFSGLGKEGDSLKTKLGSALAQILSSGNLLILGVSALTTILTLQQQGFFKSEEAAKSLSESLDEYREKLQGVTKANLEGQISAQKEISNFKLLQIQAENTNISLEKRLEAVDELKKQYPEYLKNLTDEQILTGKVGESYQNLTNDIIALSKAKALSAELDKKAGDLLTLRLQEEDRANKILELREKLQSAINNKVDAGARVAGQFTAENDDAMIIQMNIDKLIKEQLKSAEDRNKIIKEQLFIESQIVEQSSKGANFVKGTGKEIDANKEKLNQYSQGWDDYNLGIQTAENLTNKLTFSAKDYEKAIGNVLTRNESLGLVPEITGDNAWDQYTFSVYQFRDASIKANEEITNTSTKALEFGERIKSLSGKEVKINLKVEGFDETAGPSPFDVFIDSVAYAVDQLPTFEQRIADFAFAVSDILDNNLGNAFADLGNSIGEALATGGNVLSAVGKSLLSSVGKLLGDFGKQLIAFGVAGLAYSSLIKSLFTDPVTAAPKAGLAIAAGVALVAISGAISSSMRSNSGGGGGGGGGSSVGSSGVGGGSSFVGGGAQGGMFAANKDLNGELVVRGQDLVYVFGQANNRINKG
jgi:flagellar basal body L-ring protein FlgH